MVIFLDKELLKRIHNGDSNAFNILAEKWQTPIYRLAFRYFGNEQDAKDICQKTFIKAYKNIKKIRNSESFPVWIQRIAVNICKDELMSRKKKGFLYLNKTDFESESSTNGFDEIKVEFEEEIIKNDIGDILKKVIGNLPEEQRIVLILKEYQGLKFTEISEILKIPTNTAKSRMYYALKNIKNILKKLHLDKEVY